MIDKQQIIDELEKRGDQEMAQQAESRLPDQVHLGNHEVQLRELGLDPQDLASKYLGEQKG